MKRRMLQQRGHPIVGFGGGYAGRGFEFGNFDATGLRPGQHQIQLFPVDQQNLRIASAGGGHLALRPLTERVQRFRGAGAHQTGVAAIKQFHFTGQQIGHGARRFTTGEWALAGRIIAYPRAFGQLRPIGG